MAFNLSVLPSQGRAHALKSKYKGFSGPVGCLAGETVLDGQHLTVAELHQREIAPVVQTLLGPIQATVPFIKGTAALYEVTLHSGQTVRVTATHLFFAKSRSASAPSRGGWLPTSALASGDYLLASAPCRLPSSSGFGPSASRPNDPRSSNIVPNCPDGYSAYRRLCDELPRSPVDGDQVSLPSLADVLGYNHDHSNQDGPDGVPEYNHFCRRSARPSTTGYAAHGCAFADTESDASEYTHEPADGLSQSDARSLLEKPPRQLAYGLSHRFSGTQPTGTHTLSDDLCACAPQCQFTVDWAVIDSIRYVRTDTYYDLHVPVAEHYLAHGILHHNSGKTHWLCDHLLYLASRNPGRVGVLAAPTYKMLKRSSQRTFMERAAALRIEVLYRAGDGYYEVPAFGGTQIWLATLDDPDKLRGPNLAFFAVDEASYASEASWQQLEARLRDPLATEKAGIGAWTPKGWNWLYRKFIKQEKPDPNYQAVLANPMENTYLDADYYPGLMRSYSPNFAKQEVLGQYLNVFSGRAYDAFSSETEGNIWRKSGQGNYDGFLPCTYRPDRPILWSCDWNISPATSVICQSVSHTPVPTNPFAARGPDPRVGGPDKQLNVLDELYLPDTNTEQHCEAFYEKVRPRLVPGRRMHVIGYGDASGERRQSSSSDSDYAIIRRFFSRHANEVQFELRVPSANPLVKDRINAVNAMACNYNGDRRLAVHERCKMLVRDLEEVSWAMDRNENMLPTLSTKNKMLTHVSDALGYLIHFEWPIKGTIGYRKDVIL